MPCIHIASSYDALGMRKMKSWTETRSVWLSSDPYMEVSSFLRCEITSRDKSEKDRSTIHRYLPVGR